MKILGIETSCDETSIALLEIHGTTCRVISNIVSSQVEIHSPFGGVVPHLANREHQKNLVPVLLKTLGEERLINSKIQFKIQKLNKILEREPELLKQFKKYILPLETPKIDLIAITSGPGLEPALWVGINFAKALAHLWNKPLIGINHMKGHIYSNWLKPVGIKFELKNPNIKFPVLNLIVSGGHTMLVLMRGHNKYKVLGETLDDAAGEAFDKVAKMLNLGYPGGPIISKLAEKGNEKTFDLPRPMLKTKDYNFSFSGLKTAVLYTLKDLKLKTYNLKLKSDIAASFQQAAVDVLVQKTLRAAEKYRIKTILLSGGVSANKKLRYELETNIKKRYPKINYNQPLLEYTGDNAAMIALAGYFSFPDGSVLNGSYQKNKSRTFSTQKVRDKKSAQPPVIRADARMKFV